MAATPATPLPSLQWIGRALSIALIVGAIAVSALALHRIYAHPRTDDAYVRANVIGIAPHVSGPIVHLPIADNQFVRAGDLLFAIDARPYEAALAAAEADLLVADLEIQARERDVDAAAAEVERIEAQDAFDRQYLERIEPLLAKKFVTPNDVDHARTTVAASEAAVREAKERLSRARDLLGQLGDVNAYRAAAEAAAAAARLNVGYTEVRAPFDGWVTNLNISVGEYANEGDQVFALVDDREWFVMANFRETFLSSIRPGMRAEVYLMAYPGRRFAGTVQGIGWALYQSNGATVGVLPEVQPTLNWVRLAQRFPVRILLDERDPDRPFRMGATAVVTVRGFDGAGAVERSADRSVGSQAPGS